MSRRSRKGSHGSIFAQNNVENPMNSVGNVFDVAMVFAVALLVAVVMSAGLTELMTDEDLTIVKNPGQENMQIITKTDEGIEIMEINAEEQIGGGIGEVLGQAYRLDDGRVIYVPEGNNTIESSNTTNSDTDS
ncbi:hypothetical protein MmiHf6_06380 [Methanimicrococcus hongohii]|uniref:DUF2149 domain-containing protein n=1 Tax=Methanimicrococcus hongohii TaxID=3028295 RepID=A0AA97A1K4_9EURY|nr:DUF2149 domain-containing protein [Methanimicrococcus sp. Hf6]WNY23333.1 hypothetical protein MmiHf6_06380 [Methanimicrococcus sp. Hf6]